MANAAQWTPKVWVEAVLNDAGVTPTDQNVNDLLHWLPTENAAATWWSPTQAFANNPLNVTNGPEPSLAAAAQDTAKYLHMPNYSSILADLQSSAGLSQFSADVIRSPWAESHYGVAPYAPPKYVVPGRTLDYIAQTSISPDVVAPASAGTVPNATGASAAGGVSTDVFGNPLNALPGGLGSALGSIPLGGAPPLNDLINAAGSGVSTAQFLTNPIGFIISSGGTYILQGFLILVGVLLLLIGVSKMFSGQGANAPSNPVDVVVQGAKQGSKKAAATAKVAAEGAAA